MFFNIRFIQISMKLHIIAAITFCYAFLNSCYACSVSRFDTFDPPKKTLSIKKAVENLDLPYLTKLFDAQRIGPGTHFTIQKLLKYDNASPKILKLYANYISVHDYRYFVLCNDFNDLAPSFTQAIIEKFGVFDLPEFGKKDENERFAQKVHKLIPVRHSPNFIFVLNMIQHFNRTTLNGALKIEEVQRYEKTYKFIESWMRHCIKTFLLCVSRINPQYMATKDPKIINDYY